MLIKYKKYNSANKQSARNNNRYEPSTQSQIWACDVWPLSIAVITTETRKRIGPKKSDRFKYDRYFVLFISRVIFSFNL